MTHLRLRSCTTHYYKPEQTEENVILYPPKCGIIFFVCVWIEERLEEHSQMIKVGGVIKLGIDSKIKQPNRGEKKIKRRESLESKRQK